MSYLLDVVIPILIAAGLIIAFLVICNCCLRNRRRQHRQTQSLTFPPAGRNVTSVVIHSQAPLQQSLPPSGYPLYYPGYHPLPVQPVYHGMPNLTPQPPSYVEAMNPVSAAFDPMQPMVLHHSQPYTQPSCSDELSQPPYNPEYCPRI